MTSGSDICFLQSSYSPLISAQARAPLLRRRADNLSPLPRTNDFDAVAGPEQRIAPRNARNNHTIERHCDTALAGIDGLFRQQGLHGGSGKRLALTVHAD